MNYQHRRIPMGAAKYINVTADQKAAYKLLSEQWEKVSKPWLATGMVTGEYHLFAEVNTGCIYKRIEIEQDGYTHTSRPIGEYR
jgi:hypothetical protein